MKTDHEIRKNIMRRVYVMHFVREATSPALRLGILGGSLFMLVQAVSVKNIVANALATGSLNEFVLFVFSTITTTEYSVLALAAIVVGMTLWFAVEQFQKVFHIGFWSDEAIYGQPQESVISN